MTSLSPEDRQLAAELGALRERTGLSLAALADRTSASKSAWHRYLIGRNLPPRNLIEQLCALAGERPGRLLALRELAEANRRGRHGSPDSRPPSGDADRLAAPGPSGPAVPVADAEAAGAGTGAGAGAGADFAAAGAPAGREDGAVSGAGGRARAGRSAWQRAWRPLLAGMGVGLAIVGTLAFALRDGAPQPPPPGCTGPECNGKDPESQGCTAPGSAFGAVADHLFENGRRMEIRYSEECGAAWARIWLGEVGDRIEIRVPGQPVQRAEIRDQYDAQGYLYTPMTGDGPYGARACLLPKGVTTPDCFSFQNGEHWTPVN